MLTHDHADNSLLFPGQIESSLASVVYVVLTGVYETVCTQASKRICLCTASTPYAGLSGAEVMRFIQQGRRLKKPTHCSDDMYVMTK